MKKTVFSLLMFVILATSLPSIVGCDGDSGTNCGGATKDSDSKQRKQQEALLDEATKQVGMPAIKNFRERKLLKDILEMRDQTGLTTYTYVFNEMQGKLVFLGETIGFQFLTARSTRIR